MKAKYCPCSGVKRGAAGGGENEGQAVSPSGNVINRGGMNRMNNPYSGDNKSGCRWREGELSIIRPKPATLAEQKREQAEKQQPTGNMKDNVG